MTTGRTGAPSYLSAGDVDALARMTHALLTELWIVRDRVAVLEKLLEAAGQLPPQAVDRYVPDGDFARQLEALRDTMVANVAGAPFSDADRSVAALRERG